MHFSLSGDADSAACVAASILEALVFGTLFLVARHGPFLGEALRDELERVPVGRRFLQLFFTAAGWAAAAGAALLLAPFAASAAVVYFTYGLGLFYDRCLGLAWIVGISTLGPVVFLWFRHRGNDPSTGELGLSPAVVVRPERTFSGGRPPG